METASLLNLCVSLLVVVLTAFGIHILYDRKAQQTKIRSKYALWIQRANDERDAKQHTVLLETAKTNNPTDCWMTVSQLRAGFLDGTQSVRDVVVRAAQRTRLVGGRSGINAATEEFYDQAAAAAEKMTTFDETKLLFGIPICVKECMAMKGTYSTGGLACRLQQRDEHDSLIVSAVKQAGAIPIVSGNVTQLMMLPESVNRIWGRSLNPWNRARTPGGSSGGDAALVASGCVPLSLSADVAGSIRIPASFCGVVGFKPTSIGRLSFKGNMIPRVNNRSGTGIAIPRTVGPIARSVDDCEQFMRAMVGPTLWDGDENLPRIPWQHDAYTDTTTKLKIGYFDTDGWFQPCATSKRAVHETVVKLREAGHEVTKFTLPTDGWDSYGLLVAINAAEGNLRSYTEALEGEELIAEYEMLFRVANLPNWLRWLILKTGLLDKRRSHLLNQTRSGGISAYDVWQRCADLIEMRTKWSDAMAGFDALVYPAMPIPALPHGMSGDLTSTCSYMFLANMLQWPCGVVPVTLVRPDEAHYDQESLPENQRDHISNLAARVCENSVGLPIAVSVLAKNFQDETCLRVMKEVERLAQFTKSPLE